MSLDVLRTLAFDIAQKGSAVEHCGLLLRSQGKTLIDQRVAFQGPLHPDHFRLCDQWLLEQSYAAREQGRLVAGYYHSHPQGSPLTPSSQDRTGHPFGAVVVILGLIGEPGFGREQSVGWQTFRVGDSSGPWSVLEKGNLLTRAGF